MTYVSITCLYEKVSEKKNHKFKKKCTNDLS